MILARLSAAIRQQNWFAVVLEFVIVILGVVIGFQITEWRAHEARVVQATNMTQNLIEDLRDEEWRIRATRNYLRDVVLAGETALAGIAGEREMSDETLVINGFRASQYFFSGMIRSTYDELVANGDINLLENNALREAAIEYYNSSASGLAIEIDANTPYRNTLRQLIDPELHRVLVRVCSEGSGVGIGNEAGIVDILSFECSVDGYDAEIAFMAAQLRENDALIRALRWRVNEADQQHSSMEYYFDLLRAALSHGDDGETAP
jgi:hypothetical protein